MNLSGETVTLSDETVRLSAETILLSGNTVRLSGETVRLSGEPVRISVETVRLSGSQTLGLHDCQHKSRSILSAYIYFTLNLFIVRILLIEILIRTKNV